MEYMPARLISRLFSPYVVALLFFVATLNMPAYFSSAIPLQARWMILGLLAISTCILPALLSKVIHTMWLNKLKMTGRDARMAPLAIAAVFYLLSYHLLDKIQLSPIFNLFILGMAFLAVMAMLIILVGDISIYMLGAGALTGGFTALHLTLQLNLSFFIILSILVAGLAGFSRLQLDKHKPMAIYLGYALGLAVMLLLYLYL
jgi:hypothetical protein